MRSSIGAESDLWSAPRSPRRPLATFTTLLKTQNSLLGGFVDTPAAACKWGSQCNIETVTARLSGSGGAARGDRRTAGGRGRSAQSRVRSPAGTLSGLEAVLPPYLTRQERVSSRVATGPSSELSFLSAPGPAAPRLVRSLLKWLFPHCRFGRVRLGVGAARERALSSRAASFR